MAPTFCNRCEDALEEESDLWDELAELDALLERLRLKRYDLKRKINRLQVQSPIVRQLPADVMSIIFEFCLPDFTDKLLPFTDEDLSFPLSLGAICSHWRDIAWSTPYLWSSLVVRIRSQNDSHIVTGIAQEWLARSGQLPLTIRISSKSCIKTVSALADIINQYSARWSNLDLCIPDSYYRYFHAIDNHAPILKSIRFFCIGHIKIDMNLQLTCPRLERASLTYFLMGGTSIHWDNLTHLTLHFMPIIDSLLILCKTPRLVYCKVSGHCSRYREQSIGAPVLTSLKSLHLLIASFPEDFLNNITTPNLEEFCFLPNYYDPSMEVITSFLRRSACSLRSFSVIFPPFDLEGLMSLLQSMPSLNSLSIRSTRITKDHDQRNVLQLVAKVLSSQSTSLQQGFLPNLKVLEYTGELHLRPGNYFDLYSLPPADNAVHGPLHLLKLDLHPITRIPENMISYLSSLVERGITVNVSSHSEDILQSSIDYYRFRKDSLSWDWADNMDPSLISGVPLKIGER